MGDLHFAGDSGLISTSSAYPAIRRHARPESSRDLSGWAKALWFLHAAGDGHQRLMAAWHGPASRPLAISVATVSKASCPSRLPDGSAG
jgi:hypothetical protein